MLKGQKVDIIFSDINMPVMDGLDFVRQLRAQNLAAGVPVVMITTESSAEHVKQAIEAGARGYIRKPFTPEQIKERVLPLLSAASICWRCHPDPRQRDRAPGRHGGWMLIFRVCECRRLPKKG